VEKRGVEIFQGKEKFSCTIKGNCEGQKEDGGQLKKVNDCGEVTMEGAAGVGGIPVG